MQNYTPNERIVRMDDFFAEQLERQAAIMPPGMADKAAILRKKAAMYRTSDDTKMLTIHYHWANSASIADDAEEADTAPALKSLPEGLAIREGEVIWDCGRSATHGLLGEQNRRESSSDGVESR